MSFSARYVPAVLLTLFSLAVTLPAQSTNTPAAKVPRGSVSGRVTIKDKGAGGVAVSLRKTEMNPYEQYLKATTDHDGFYRITNVAPGSYEVAPSAPAYVPADNRRAKTVIVGEDENVEDINFSLVRGGVITGRVRDADGRPVILQQVNVFPADAFTQRQQSPQEQRQPIFPAGNTTTDDRGIYRMYGLRAGRYKVAVGRSEEIFQPAGLQNRASYKQVFHPDVTEHAKATIIEVTEGSEATDVDISLGAVLQTFSASGRLVDEKGLPIPNLPFSLQRLVGQRAEIVNAPVTSNSQGEFVAEGIMPGRYQFFLYQEMNRGDLRVEPFTFEVVDQDVSNLIVKFSKGASLSGFVVIESEDKTALQKLTQMRLRGYPTSTPGGTGIVGSSSSMVAADGSFRLGGLPPGNINVQLAGTAGPFDLKGYVISRIERDGVQMPRGIEVKDGEQIGGIRIVVAYGNGSIRGAVKLENGSLPAGVQMSVRLMKPGETFFFRPSQVDARGNFLMDGIPPGNYELVLQLFGAGAPRMPSPKREVSVQNGVVTDVIITVDLPTPPQPQP
ncbi:MAG TPA: carboxypeptidase-like regulatory domain-containing protein [Pyrinomonadaceae bacterium]|nr:carboxypeptidase-like regulatory domain-containing protein [Pyrinomonadaceae bacterium]